MGFLSSIGNAFSNPVSALETVATGGLNLVPGEIKGASSDISSLGSQLGLGSNSGPMLAGAGLSLATGLPMFASLGAGITSGLGAASSAQNQNAANAAMAAAQMNFSAQQAQKQMDFQSASVKNQQDYETQMSNTSYQRATKDMEAAGINPMLAYMQGGASTPSISAPSGASGSTVPYSNVAVPNIAAGAISSAKDMLNTVQSISESQSRIKANDAQAQASLASANLSGVSAQVKQADAFIEGLKKTWLEKLVNSASAAYSDAQKWLAKPIPGVKDYSDGPLDVVPNN